MQIRSVERSPAGGRGSESGFTTIEMLVACILFAIVIGSIYGLLEIGRSARFNAMQSNEAAQDVRVGLNTMAKDVLNAGVDYPNTGPLMPNGWLTTHLLVPPDTNPAADYCTPVIPGNQLNALTNTQSGSAVTTLTDQVTLASTDNTFNGGNPLNIGSMTASQSWLTVSDSVGATPCNIGDLVFVNSSSAGNGVVGLITAKASNLKSNDTIVVAAADPMAVNDLSVTPSTNSNMFKVGTPASAQRITMVTYYVLDDGTGQGTGTLMRRVWGGNSGGSTPTALAYSDQPLAFDVTALNIQYYLQNGTITVKPADSDFPNIRQLSLTITVRSPRRNPQNNQFYQDTLTAVMNTRNLGYEKN